MSRPSRRDRIRIAGIRSERTGGVLRVTADVDGRPVWFEADGLALEPAAEAWASAFLIPALHRRAMLDLEAPVDPVWLENVRGVEGLLREWWKLPEKPPSATVRPPERVHDGERALFFSGGVDSFYTLLRSGERVDRLLLLHGFDYALDDVARLEATERMLREVASARGIGWAVIRTDAREHPLFEGVEWERAHGGVLAAVAHLLGENVGEVLISSSVNQENPMPWGSHWKLDPLWSSSRRRIVHVGQALRKEDKIREIAGEPLAHRHLRVCWENRSRWGNCSRCYKCLYARLVLAELGELERFEGFEGPDTLAAHLDALPRGKAKMRTFLALLESPRLPADVKCALMRLVERTKREQQPMVRLRRAAASAVFGLWPRRPQPEPRIPRPGGDEPPAAARSRDGER